MKLKDLLRIAFNAGLDFSPNGFDAWWVDEGEERHDDFLDEQDATEDDDAPDP